ncbi:MAG TPA: acyltransferase [Firmicutes bacterium]|nr:acyltransferase [Bacillota bacterium]
MARWTRLVNPWRAALNFTVIYLCRFLPWVGVKRFLYRCLGMRVGKNVAVGLGAMFDIFFPHLISLGDNCVIGYGATVLAHEFLVREWRTGPVHIGRNVLIGANATVLAGVVIGDSATVGAGAVVCRDVPPGAFVAGVPAREIPPSREVTPALEAIPCVVGTDGETTQEEG